ncbi:MAG: hypothetical protein U0573_07585 [Phycisphaerales bacterium]|nr:hypothetical protein [Planctomycetota bacterium]
MINHRIAWRAALAASAVTACASGQWRLPQGRPLPASRVNANTSGPLALSKDSPQVLWIRNDMTGQVVQPGIAARRDDPPPVTIFDNYTHNGGVSPINLNWNYPEAYTDANFEAPAGGDPLIFTAINISSDPTDPDDAFQTVDGEKLSLFFEPWSAWVWPSTDLNEPQPIQEYSTVFASFSEQLEVRVCRIYFFALQDVNLPFDSITNKYELELQLSFGFASFPFQGIASPVTFDLTGFDPVLKTKGKGVILTHWMRMSEPPPCPADLNGDTMVDDADFSVFIVQYDELDCAAETMPFFCSADLNFDGLVDDADFSIFVVAYDALLCPQPSVIRKVFAPIAGGRVRWTPDNDPLLSDPPSEATSAPGWPHVNSLLTVPNFAEAGTHFGDEPSFCGFFSTITGFHTLDDSPLQITAETDQLKAEYERFFNSCVESVMLGGHALQIYPFFDVKSYLVGGLPGTDWLPNATPKAIRLVGSNAARK